MKLFVLNDVDYTQHILMPTYKVQEEDVYKTWEDATYTTHKRLLRQRMKGTFTIYFDDNDELDTFLDTLRNLELADSDNYAEAELYDNRGRTLKKSKYSFKIALVNNRPYFGNKKHDGYEVTIEEK